MTTLAEQYEQLRMARSSPFYRAHKSAVLTIPSILPMEGQEPHTLPVPMQSVGARGVNNISSKLLLTLFPPTQPFMRLELEPVVLKNMDENEKKESQENLHLIEQQAMARFDNEGWRPAVAEALRLAVVTGDALIYRAPDKKSRPATFDIRQYTVDRDPEGNLLRVILRQQIGVTAASKLTGLSVEALTEMATAPEGKETNEAVVALYTGAIRLPDGKYLYCQEIGGVELNNSKATFSAEDLPLIPLRFQPIYGSGYGRGYVEEYHGDLLALEYLSKTIIQGSAAMAKVIWLIRPSATTKAATLASAPTGAIRQGNEEDVGTLKADKNADLAVAEAVRMDLKRSLANAFLLNSSVQRQGERVTAEEIRFVSQELEDALGGVYAGLMDTFQMPVVKHLFRLIQKDNSVKVGPAVKPIIAAGLESISRNHTVFRLQQFLGAVNQLLGPEQVATYIKPELVMSRMAVGLNLDTDFIRTDAEVAQVQQEQQAQALVETVGAPVANNLTKPQ